MSSELKMACEELFEAMDLKEVKVEDDLSMSTSSFLTDFIHMIDEIKRPSDIVQLGGMWVDV